MKELDPSLIRFGLKNSVFDKLRFSKIKQVNYSASGREMHAM